MNRHLFDKLIGSGELLDVRRSGLDVDDIRGFLTQRSDELLLISVVSGEIEQSGFSVVRLEDISLIRWRNGSLEAWRSVLPAADPRDMPRLDLTNWETVIRDLSRVGDWISIMTETVDQDRCYIASSITVADGIVIGEEVDADGDTNGSFALELEAITRVDFGDRYMEALKRVNKMHKQ